MFKVGVLEVTRGPHLQLVVLEAAVVVIAGAVATADLDHLQGEKGAVNVQIEEIGALGDTRLHHHQSKEGNAVHHLLTGAQKIAPLQEIRVRGVGARWKTMVAAQLIEVLLTKMGAVVARLPALGTMGVLLMMM